MKPDENPLPADVESLHEIVREQSSRITFLKLRADAFEERYNLLRAQVFGRKSHKLPIPADDQQMRLFDEAEQVLAETPEGAGEVVEQAEEAAKVAVAAHTRKKRGRRPLPAGLPRVDIVHDLPEEEKVCACGHAMARIGEEVSEKLDIVPAEIRVERHIRPKYACKHCEGVESDAGAVAVAPMPPQLIPRGIVTPGLLAYVATGKFADGLPYYRQEKIFSRIGIDLSRQTMASWLIQAADRLKPLTELLIEELRTGPLIGIDETVLQVLNEPGRKNTTKSYMWVFRGGGGKPVLLFQYDPSRSAEVVRPVLGGWTGFVQTDGWDSYRKVLGPTPGITLVNCWAHARGYFADVVKARRPQPKAGAKTGSAEVALAYIRALYRIESQADKDEVAPDERTRRRREQSAPVLAEFKAWLEKRQAQTPPQGLLGKAINYCLNHWAALTVFLEDGRIRPDNNLVENAIRPFVVGRKNWLFSGSPSGAEASALLYTLIENARANGLEPYRYLRHLFTNFPKATTPDAQRALLPQHLDPAALQAPTD